MENECDKCYQMRQETISECPNCGKQTYATRVIHLSSVSKCKACGYGCASAGGFPEACYTDERLFTITIQKPEDKALFVKLAKALNIRALELNTLFDDDQIEMKYKILECIQLERQLTELGVICKVCDDADVQFPRIRNCQYISLYSKCL